MQYISLKKLRLEMEGRWMADDFKCVNCDDGHYLLYTENITAFVLGIGCAPQCFFLLLVHSAPALSKYKLLPVVCSQDNLSC